MSNIHSIKHDGLVIRKATLVTLLHCIKPSAPTKEWTQFDAGEESMKAKVANALSADLKGISGNGVVDILRELQRG